MVVNELVVNFGMASVPQGCSEARDQGICWRHRIRSGRTIVNVGRTYILRSEGFSMSAHMTKNFRLLENSKPGEVFFKERAFRQRRSHSCTMSCRF